MNIPPSNPRVETDPACGRAVHPQQRSPPSVRMEREAEARSQ